METVRYKAGDVILKEGEDGDTAFLILRGAVDVSVGSGAASRTVCSLTNGDVFGEMSLIDPGPRSATVTASEDTMCTITSYDDFVTALEDDPKHAMAFMQTLVRRLRQTNELMTKLDPQRRSLRQRLADMQKAFIVPQEDLSDEERERQQLLMMHGWPLY